MPPAEAGRECGFLMKPKAGLIDNIFADAGFA